MRHRIASEFAFDGGERIGFALPGGEVLPPCL